jgi:hypothetical protein
MIFEENKTAIRPSLWPEIIVALNKWLSLQPK